MLVSHPLTYPRHWAEVDLLPKGMRPRSSDYLSIPDLAKEFRLNTYFSGSLGFIIKY
jgi:hypothetical protein